MSSWDNWGDERGCDEGHWYAHTWGRPWGLPEVVGTVQQVHCNRRRLLRRGLEFHVCTINKNAHTKKRLETYLMILVHFVSSDLTRISKTISYYWYKFGSYSPSSLAVCSGHTGTSYLPILMRWNSYNQFLLILKTNKLFRMTNTNFTRLYELFFLLLFDMANLLTSHPLELVLNSSSLINDDDYYLGTV